MTRAEAIGILRVITPPRESKRIFDEFMQARDMAIEALNRSEIPNGSNLISRQEAIDDINKYFNRIEKLKRRGLNNGEKAIFQDMLGIMKSLPSAQPEILACGSGELIAQPERKVQCNFCNMSICTLEGRHCSRKVIQNGTKKKEAD